MPDFTSGYTTLLKKQWRALVYDYDAMLNGIGDGSKLYCLTNFQAMWLQQNVDYYRWQTRWNNLSIDSRELGIQADELELALMTCIEIQPYMLEFNYLQAVGLTLTVYNEDYDIGGIPELNPNTPTDFYSGDNSADRLDALCTACNIYIRSYASNWLTKASVVLGVTTVIAIAVSISIVGGVIAGTVLAGLALITQVAMDAFQDEDALDEVVCCMNDALSGSVINQANFESALDACGFTGGTNEAIIRDIISADLVQFDNWLSFLNSLGDAFILAQNDVTVCPCVLPPSTYYLELDATVSQGNVTVSKGSWVSGQGFRELDEAGGSSCYTKYTALAEFGCTRIEYRSTKTPVTNTGFRQVKTWSASEGQLKTVVSGAEWVTPTIFSHSFAETQTIKFYWDQNSSPQNSNITIDRLRITIISTGFPQEFIDNGWNEYIP